MVLEMELVPGRMLGDLIIGDKIGSVLEVLKRNRDKDSQLELRQPNHHCVLPGVT